MEMGMGMGMGMGMAVASLGWTSRFDASLNDNTSICTETFDYYEENWAAIHDKTDDKMNDCCLRMSSSSKRSMS